MCSAILVFLFGSPSDHHRFALQGLATIAVVGNLGAMKYSGNYFLPDSNPLVHTWSLSVEEQIYIFLPLILLLITFNLKDQIKRMTVAFKLIGLTSFFLFILPNALVPIFHYINVADESSISFYSSLTRIWQFILGGMLFLMENKNVKEVQKRTAGIFAAFLLSILLVFPIFIHIAPKMGSLLASVVTVWLIRQRVLQMLPSVFSNTFEWLGYRSYSIYLVHMPLAYLAHYYSESHLLPLNSAFLEVGAFSLSIGFGVFCYRFIANSI
jgi:peptidoglycan/LPS O-acetylase OafA/YrhL